MDDDKTDSITHQHLVALSYDAGKNDGILLQMGIPTLNLQSLMSSIAANEKAAAAVAAAAAAGRSPVPLEPGTAAEVR